MSLAGDYSGGTSFRSRGSNFSSIVGNDPAAGVDILYTVPVGSGLLLTAVKFRLVTSAVVANRIVCLNIDDDAGNTVAEYCTGINQAASLTRDYTFMAGAGYAQSAFADIKLLVGIGTIYLPDGWVIKTTTVAKDAGDNYGAPIITGELFK